MKIIKEFYQILLCLTLMISSVGTYAFSSVLLRMLSQAESPTLGLIIFLMGAVASVSCLITATNIVLKK